MTVEIVRKPEPPPRYELECSSCHTVFRYDREDLKSWTDQRGEPVHKYVPCPTCGHGVAHSTFGSGVRAKVIPWTPGPDE
jgi:uncharacterized protein YlaI